MWREHCADVAVRDNHQRDLDRSNPLCHRRLRPPSKGFPTAIHSPRRELGAMRCHAGRKYPKRTSVTLSKNALKTLCRWTEASAEFRRLCSMWSTAGIPRRHRQCVSSTRRIPTSPPTSRWTLPAGGARSPATFAPRSPHQEIRPSPSPNHRPGPDPVAVAVPHLCGQI